MAKANKSQDNDNSLEQEGHIIETPEHTPVAERIKPRLEAKKEIDLKYGQCIVAPVGAEDEEILTTLADWNSLYNAGANHGRFVLKAEKKSL